MTEKEIDPRVLQLVKDMSEVVNIECGGWQSKYFIRARYIMGNGTNGLGPNANHPDTCYSRFTEEIILNEAATK